MVWGRGKVVLCYVVLIILYLIQFNIKILQHNPILLSVDSRPLDGGLVRAQGQLWLPEMERGCVQPELLDLSWSDSPLDLGPASLNAEGALVGKQPLITALLPTDWLKIRMIYFP